MRNLNILFVLAVLATLSACGGGAPNLTGNWAGTLTVTPGGSVPLTLSLIQNDTSVTGTLSLQGQTQPINGTITGTSLTLFVGNTPLSGTGTANSINVSASGVDEQGQPLTITITAARQ